MLCICREEKLRGCWISYLQPWWKWNFHVPNRMFINNPKALDTESSLAFGLPSAEGILQSVSRHRSRFAGAPDHRCSVYKETCKEEREHRLCRQPQNSLSTAYVILDFFHRLVPIFPLPFFLLPFVSLSFRVSLATIRATNTCSHPRGSPGSPEPPGKTRDCASPAAASWSVGRFPYWCHC